jgi:hypothetical protein
MTTTTAPAHGCFTCHGPVADNDGFVCVDSCLAGTEPPTPVRWECHHYRCAATDEHGDYWIGRHRLTPRRHADETDDWTRHLARKDWIAFTDWRTCPIPALVRISGGSVTNVLPFPGSPLLPSSSHARSPRIPR